MEECRSDRLKELMARLGHSSVRAAMIYQHATRERPGHREGSRDVRARRAERRGDASGRLGTRREGMSPTPLMARARHADTRRPASKP